MRAIVAGELRGYHRISDVGVAPTAIEPSQSGLEGLLSCGGGPGERDRCASGCWSRLRESPVTVSQDETALPHPADGPNDASNCSARKPLVVAR